MQKKGLTPLDALDIAHAKIQKIKAQYLSKVPYWGEKVKNILKKYATKEIVINFNPILTFTENVCNHLEERFPESEFQDWVAFDIAKLKSDCDFAFGVEEITSLCKKFAMPVETMQSQYNDFKFYAKRKLQTKSVNSFLELVEIILQCEDYPDLAKLLDIGGTFMASSADCERGFSLMNSIKDKQRNRLKELHLDMLVRIKSYLQNNGTVDLDLVYDTWVHAKDRRQKNI